MKISFDEITKKMVTALLTIFLTNSICIGFLNLIGIGYKIDISYMYEQVLYSNLAVLTITICLQLFFMLFKKEDIHSNTVNKIILFCEKLTILSFQFLPWIFILYIIDVFNYGYHKESFWLLLIAEMLIVAFTYISLFLINEVKSRNIGRTLKSTPLFDGMLFGNFHLKKIL